MHEPSYVEYYKSGIVKQIVPTLNGKIHGVIKDYYRNGNIESELSVKYGRVHGVWRSYSGLGRLTLEMKFWNGWLLEKMKTYNHKNGSKEAFVSFSVRYIVSRNMKKLLNNLISNGSYETF